MSWRIDVASIGAVFGASITPLIFLFILTSEFARAAWPNNGQSSLTGGACMPSCGQYLSGQGWPDSNQGCCSGYSGPNRSASGVSYDCPVCVENGAGVNTAMGRSPSPCGSSGATTGTPCICPCSCSDSGTYCDGYAYSKTCTGSCIPVTINCTGSKPYVCIPATNTVCRGQLHYQQQCTDVYGSYQRPDCAPALDCNIPPNQPSVSYPLDGSGANKNWATHRRVCADIPNPADGNSDPVRLEIRFGGVMVTNSPVSPGQNICLPVTSVVNPDLGKAPVVVQARLQDYNYAVPLPNEVIPKNSPDATLTGNWAARSGLTVRGSTGSTKICAAAEPVGYVSAGKSLKVQRNGTQYKTLLVDPLTQPALATPMRVKNELGQILAPMIYSDDTTPALCP